MNCSQVTLKIFIMLQNIYISNKLFSSELSFHRRNERNIKQQHNLFSTLKIMRHVS